MKYELSLQNAELTAWNFLNVTNKPVASKAIVVIGAASYGPIREGLRLWQEGFAPHICFTSMAGHGGKDFFGVSENEAYLSFLLTHNVPREAILTKALSVNILQEAEVTIPFLRSHDVKTDRLILVGDAFQQRMAYCAFCKKHPEGTYINCPDGDELKSGDPVHLSLLLHAIDSLKRDFENGRIEDPGITERILNARNIIRTYTPPWQE